MKRISTILFCLLLLGGLAAESRAVTSGSYRCTAFQGDPDPDTSLVPVIIHYNPTNNTQQIRRIRIFDQTGAVILDTGALPVGALPVPAQGSTFLAVDFSATIQGEQVIINWSQGADTSAPIPRVDNLLFNSVSGNFTGTSSRNCP